MPRITTAQKIEQAYAEGLAAGGKAVQDYADAVSRRQNDRAARIQRLEDVMINLSGLAQANTALAATVAAVLKTFLEETK